MVHFDIFKAFDYLKVTKVINYYTIEVINSLPEIDFTITPDNGNTLTLFEFTDMSTDSDGEIEEWLWNFGDGNSSFDLYPLHIYEDYEICDKWKQYPWVIIFIWKKH